MDGFNNEVTQIEVCLRHALSTNVRLLVVELLKEDYKTMGEAALLPERLVLISKCLTSEIDYGKQGTA